MQSHTVPCVAPFDSVCVCHALDCAGASAPPLPAAAQAAAGPAAGASGGAEFEAKVQQLQGLGFPRDHCEAALRQAEGNVDLAASVLFGGF